MQTFFWVECQSFWCALAPRRRPPIKVLLSRYYSDVEVTFGSLLSLLPSMRLASETSLSASRLLGNGPDPCVFLSWSGKKKHQTTHPHQHANKVGMTVCKNGCRKKKPQSQEITLIEWKLRNDRQRSLSPGYEQYFHALPIILFASILVYFY